MRFTLSRRTCIKWLLGLFGANAFAQELPKAYQAASSDPDDVIKIISTPDLQLGLSSQGHVIWIKLSPHQTEEPVRLCTVLANCEVEGQTSHRSLESGGVEFVRTLVHLKTQERCRLIEQFLPSGESIRWHIEIQGLAGPWTTGIETQIAWLNSEAARVWTAWGQPPGDGTHWSDPLVFAKFSDRTLKYGGLAPGPTASESFSLPIVTIVDTTHNSGLSIVQSPEDGLLDLELQTTELGDATLRRDNHRISSNAPLSFSIDLIAHSADWRPGLGWMVRRYPDFFEPASQRTYELDGCGAYSGYQGNIDVSRLAHMAFSLNWNARFDFPFQGMMFPPVAPDTEWKSWYQKTTSISRMSEYDNQMKSRGFHVLEYFVTTEAGNYIQKVPPPKKAATDDELWRDPNDFIHYQVPDAVVRDEAGNMLYSNWFGNVVMDPAEPVWQKCLLAQARHMVEELKDSDGIAIDRMDWLATYNVHRDDGYSWINDRPARSLINSWKETLARLGPIFHEANKRIYVNCLTPRIDCLQHIDGIYTEFGHNPWTINQAALMGVQRPVILWTDDINELRPDPDAFFQSYLHLGAFITVPYPEADHTIGPDPWVDAEYLKYGRLFNAIRGRRWILTSNVVSCVNSTAKVNFFEIPGGFVIPVTFGAGPQAEIVCKIPHEINADELTVQVLHPDAEQWEDLSVSVESENSIRLHVPLKRGCAMVRLVYAWIEPDIATIAERGSIVLRNNLKNSTLHYTTNGTDPTPESPQYATPIEVNRSVLIKASIFRSDRQFGRTLFRQVYKV
jgi:hypothetical protein